MGYRNASPLVSHDRDQWELRWASISIFFCQGMSFHLAQHPTHSDCWRHTSTLPVIQHSTANINRTTRYTLYCQRCHQDSATPSTLPQVWMQLQCIYKVLEHAVSCKGEPHYIILHAECHTMQQWSSHKAIARGIDYLIISLETNKHAHSSIHCIIYVQCAVLKCTCLKITPRMQQENYNHCIELTTSVWG